MDQKSQEIAFPRKTKRGRRANLILIGLGVVLVVLGVLSFLVGRYPISPDKVIGMLFGNVFPIQPFWGDQEAIIFFNVRLPRIVLAMLVGCCLAAAGAAYQGTFQNPLVSPDILGASQGAALGAAIAILLGFTSFGVSVLAFVLAIGTVLLVVLVSQAARGNQVLTVVLAGVMVSSLAAAGVSFAKLVADPADQLPAITYWLMGSLTSASLSDIKMVIVPMVAGLVVLFVLRWRINILTMGDEEASTMGVNTKRLRLIIILAATLITAASVAVTGIIGWVGLVIPHLSRMLIGSDYRKLMPASMLMGASFLLLVDDFSRLLTTAEIPIGILTAFIGAPFFLYLITKQGRR
ncbi:MAG: iron ABC transporter permease [bacterium]|nr:iron ABC transporter permease [bacterium]